MTQDNIILFMFFHYERVYQKKERKINMHMFCEESGGGMGKVVRWPHQAEPELDYGG